LFNQRLTRVARRLLPEQSDETISQAILETRLEKNLDHPGCSRSHIFL
jgi:hypothetical protein